ncbi:MAG: universal stress protein [Halalkalicoccus sp.]
MARFRVLVPVDVSRDFEPSAQLFRLLEAFDPVILGYYPIPEQTTPEQARGQFEAEAVDRVEEVAAPFVASGLDVESVLVFTPDRAETIDRVAEEYACDAVLSPGEIERLERVLVPVRGGTNLDRIVAFVDALVAEVTVEVTLLHVAPEPDRRDESELLLRGARERLVERDLDAGLFDLEVRVAERPIPAIAEVAATHDAVVIGETAPSLKERIFGDRPERLVETVSCPVLIVRKDHAAPDADAESDPSDSVPDSRSETS